MLCYNLVKTKRTRTAILGDAEHVLDLILSSKNELVDNVQVHEPLGSSDHNRELQIA